MEWPEEIHRVIAIPGNGQVRNTPDPSGADAGDFIQWGQKGERLRHPGTVTEALRNRQAGL